MILATYLTVSILCAFYATYKTSKLEYLGKSDLERFAIQFVKDMKNISAPINVNVETKTT